MTLEFPGDIKLAFVNEINFVWAIKEYTKILRNNMSELLNCFFFQEVIKNVFQIARVAGKNKK